MAQAIGSDNSKQPRKSRLTIGLTQWLNVLPFVAIGIVGVLVFVVYPMIQNVKVSFQEFNILPGTRSPWVGWDNYKDVFDDPNRKFLIALKNTFLNVAVTVPINWFLAVFFASLIHARFVRMKVTFRTLYYLPIVTSWIVVALLFKYLFADGSGGFVNYVLLNLGFLSEPIAWKSHYWSAMIMIWLFHIWKTVGWGVVIYMAALQGIPRDLYEAADMDGASPTRKFLRVTLPMLRPITLFVLINLINGAFGFFPQVYFITAGGPMNQTQVIPSLIYMEAFKHFHFGEAAAMGVMMGLLVFTVTYYQMTKIGKQRLF
ncbi:carbohydrate ABC transporter permease [Cohnella cholangitidis]|uniref:Sugar ABC transporter permease n=1 Tax=Cohnella cholangitidis TaxID=2598458 RepID=A0A7G5BWB4_9BACL|nr:sugar ABC transporter permease [Cohnella cholangitidis]QMV41248.1 sugar ABC transporter permease [Cohnella cholangitidis]